MVQEVVTNHLKKKKCKQVKWLSEEALQIAEERREAKGKGDRERYTQLSAEFQRTAWQVSRGSAGEDQADEQAGVTRLRWRGSGR